MKRRSQPRSTPEGFEPGAMLNRHGMPDVAVRFATSSYDADAHTVDGVFSTGARVQRCGIVEELAVTPEAVDLTRVGLGQVHLLDSHNGYSLSGNLGAVEAAWIESGQLVGRIRFAATPEGQAAEGMVQRREVTGLSCGYRVTTWTLSTVENNIEVWRADRWELLEVSLVLVPADPLASVRSAAPPAARADARSQETDDMRRNISTAPGVLPAAAPTPPAPEATRIAPAAPASAAIVAPPMLAVIETEVSARASAPAALMTPVEAIELVEQARSFGLADDALVLVRAGNTAAQIRTEILQRAAQRQATGPTPSNIQVQVDEADSRRRAISDAILARALPGRFTPHESAREFRGMSLLRMAEEVLSANGVRVRGLTPYDIAQRAFLSTSDFPAILGNAVNRSLRTAYEQSSRTYQQWMRRMSAADFRDITAVSMSDLQSLPEVAEGEPAPRGSFGDGAEKFHVKKYERIISITYEAIINDDLNAFSRLPQMIGGAAARTETEVAYGLLGLNTGTGPLMSDSVALFDATAHKNLNTTNTDPSIAALSAIRLALRRQKGPNGSFIVVLPRFVIAPPKQETLLEQLFATITINSRDQVMPDQLKSLTPIIEPYLDVIATGDWYVAADPNQFDTLAYAFLDGQDAPFTEELPPGAVSGQSIKVRHVFGAGAVDFRGVYKQKAAA